MRATATSMALSALLALTLAAHATAPVKPQSGNPPRYAYGRIVKSNMPPMPADWKPQVNPWVEPAEPRHIHPETKQQIVPLEDRYLAKPLVDEPMRSPSICRGPDGTFYLIGATPRKMEDGSLNWDYGNAIKMWKSADLKSWESLGTIWDLNTPKWSPEHGHNYGWLAGPRGGGYADSYRHTWNVTGPRLYYLRDTFWIAFSAGDMGTGLLKSTSGKAEGPYILWGKDRSVYKYARITVSGSDPSLFVDDDGSVYWLWSPAWIAKMKDDLTGLAEPPRQLTCEPHFEADVLVGRRGPTLFKANGLYHLAAADLQLRLGIQVEDTLVATSKELFGRYSKRVQMFKHSGPISVFQDGAGKYWATVCGSDRYAAVRDRAGIVPLEWITHVGFESWPPPGILRAHPLKVFTERGPWHKLLPLFVKTGSYFQDQHLTQGPDGYFYASGSMCGEPNAGKMPIYRSRDLKEWEEILVRTFDDDEELTPEAKQTPQRVKGEDQWSRYYMSTKINWVPKLKTFAINYETLTTPGTSGTLLSTTGRGEGPYKRVAPGFNCGWFFQDDNDEFYMAWGVNGLFKLNDDFKVAKGLPGPRPPSGTAAFEDCSCGMVKMFGKYIFMTITCGNEAWLKPAVEYGAAYLQSDRPEGPWGEWMPGPRHCAWGYAFRGLDGHWYSSLKSIGSCAGLPVRCIYMVRLKTELRDGQVFMDIDDDWTPDDYQPVTEWKGQGEYSPYTDTAPGPKKK